MIRKTLMLLSIAFTLALVPACGKKCCGNECDGYENSRMDDHDKDGKELG